MAQVPLIQRILGTASVDEVESAYQLDYETDWGHYVSSTSVDVRKDVLKIGGTIYCDDVEVGDFERTLKYEGGRGLAFHNFLEIRTDHRERGLAKEHYTRAIRFYDRTPIRRVELVAYGDGPWIWPQDAP